MEAVDTLTYNNGGEGAAAFRPRLREYLFMQGGAEGISDDSIINSAQVLLMNPQPKVQQLASSSLVLLADSFEKADCPSWAITTFKPPIMGGFYALAAKHSS